MTRQARRWQSISEIWTQPISTALSRRSLRRTQAFNVFAFWLVLEAADSVDNMDDTIRCFDVRLDDIGVIDPHANVPSTFTGSPAAVLTFSDLPATSAAFTRPGTT